MPLARKPRQQLPELAARDGIDAGRRLVEQDHIRLVHQGAGESELLLHAAGQPIGQARSKLGELRDLEQPLAPRGVVDNAVDLGEERDVLVDAEIAVQAEALRQVADLGCDRAVLLHRIVAGHADGAAVGMQQAAQQPDARRLAGAVRADEPEHLAAGDLERQVVHGDRGPVLSGDTIEAQHRAALAPAHGCACSGITASTGMPCLSTPSLLSTVTRTR